MIQKSVDASRIASRLRPCWQQIGEHRDERRGERRIREQVAEQVRDVERDRERGRRPARAEVARREDLSQHPGDPGDPGRDREDRGVSGYRTATAWRCRGGPASPESTAEPAKAAIVRRCAAMPDGGPALHSRWRTSSHRRSGFYADERERLENRRYTSAIKTYTRELREKVAARRARRADATLRTLTSTIDKAVKRGALHRNTGARKKSLAARIRAALARSVAQREKLHGLGCELVAVVPLVARTAGCLRGCRLRGERARQAAARFARGSTLQRRGDLTRVGAAHPKLAVRGFAAAAGLEAAHRARGGEQAPSAARREAARAGCPGAARAGRMSLPRHPLRSAGTPVRQPGLRGSPARRVAASAVTAPAGCRLRVPGISTSRNSRCWRSPTCSIKRMRGLVVQLIPSRSACSRSQRRAPAGSVTWATCAHRQP